jgi:hypothetical protein
MVIVRATRRKPAGRPRAAPAARPAVGGAQRAAVLERSSSGPGDGSTLRLRAKLRGFEETPAISTTGTGRFLAELSGDGQSLSFELTYADLQGDAGGAVTGAHVHLGQKGVAGGIAIHLCGGGGGTDPCPAPPATLTGTSRRTTSWAPPARASPPGNSRSSCGPPAPGSPT